MMEDRMKTTWYTAGASVRGISHAASDTPCQDAQQQCMVGDWFIGIVSDGAGSATHSHFGSRMVASTLKEYLKVNLRETGDELDEVQLKKWLINAIEKARVNLSSRARGKDDLANYHATVVGAVVSPKGGWLFHIGDGMALVGQSQLSTSGQDKRVDYWRRYTLSQPENGDYANETFFFTEDRWLEKLRLTRIDHPVDTVLLCSDGAMPFVVQDKRPNRSFIDVVLRNLYRKKLDTIRNQYVESVLSDEAMDAFTNDDKTLLVAQNPRYASYDVVEEDEATKPEPEAVETVLQPEAVECPGYKMPLMIATFSAFALGMLVAYPLYVERPATQRNHAGLKFYGLEQPSLDQTVVASLPAPESKEEKDRILQYVGFEGLKAKMDRQQLFRPTTMGNRYQPHQRPENALPSGKVKSD